jgi:hypothetical protein
MPPVQCGSDRLLLEIPRSNESLHVIQDENLRIRKAATIEGQYQVIESGKDGCLLYLGSRGRSCKAIKPAIRSFWIYLSRSRGTLYLKIVVNLSIWSLISVSFLFHLAFHDPEGD